MAHKIEQHSNGAAAFASARISAWHQLGTVTPDCFTADQAMELAYLGKWDVRKEPIYVPLPTGRCVDCTSKTGKLHEDICPMGDESEAEHGHRKVTDDCTARPIGVDGYFATIRTHPVSGLPEPLGCVGEEYTPIQNEEMAAMLQAIVDETGAVFETAGSLRGGREVFMSLKLPEGIKVAGDDALDLYLIGMNAHDGRRAMEVVTDLTRVVCANTQAIALRGYKSRYTVRHVQGAAARIQEAREGLKLTFEVAQAFQAEADKMVSQALAVADFEKVCQEIWPKPAETSTPFIKDTYNNRMGELLALFKTADTQENCRKTNWAGVQAIGEYVDHLTPIRGKGDHGLIRADRALFGRGKQVKEQAFKLLQVV